MQSEREPALLPQDEYLRLVLDVAGVLVLVCDTEGRIVLFNRACEQLTGYRHEDVLGRYVWDFLVRPEDTAANRDMFRAQVLGSPPREHEGDWLTRDGSRRWIHWNTTALPDAAGRTQRLVSTGVDITERKRIEEQFGESVDRYQAILDTAVDGIITINDRGLIQSFNRAAERIFGYRAAEVVGRNVSILMPPPYKEQHDQFIGNYLRTRQKKIIGIGREVEGRRKDGTVFPMELAVGEVLLPGGRLFTGITRDITDRKHAEDEARQRLNELSHVMRMRSMGELASGLAHEINQPLTAIISHAQACLRLLASGTADAGLLKDSLAQIADQGERAGEIIRRLRSFVQKGKMEKQPAYLNASVRDVLWLFSHEFKQHGVQVQLELQDDLPRVDMDRVQIEQVLFNLLKNAVDAMEEVDAKRRDLHIVTRATGHDGVEVAIGDSGKGFATGIADKLFEPFFTTKPLGLGQGLSICRTIVEAHGGTIRAEAKPGGGAIFSFRLPLISSR